MWANAWFSAGWLGIDAGERQVGERAVAAVLLPLFHDRNAGAAQPAGGGRDVSARRHRLLDVDAAPRRTRRAWLRRDCGAARRAARIRDGNGQALRPGQAARSDRCADRDGGGGGEPVPSRRACTSGRCRASRRHRRRSGAWRAHAVAEGVRGAARRGRILASLLLLCGTGIALWHHPLGGAWFALALGLYAAALWRYPALCLPAVLALLPLLDFSPWSGWILLNEFDLLIAVTLAVRLLRRIRRRRASGNVRRREVRRRIARGLVLRERGDRSLSAVALRRQCARELLHGLQPASGN